MAAADPSRERAPGESTEERLLALARGLGAELSPERAGALARLGPEASLERDFGLDSLGRAELLTRVESEFAASLPDSVMTDAETVGDVLRALLASRGGEGARPGRAARLSAAAAPESASGEAVRSIPQRVRTLNEALAEHARLEPERVHVTFLDEDGAVDEITYGQLAEGGRRTATRLAELGVRHGDAVALMLPTGRTYFEAFVGALMAGAIPVPIYPPLRPSQIESHLRRHARILANAGARVLVTVPAAKAVSRMLAGLVPSLAGVLTPAELAARADASAPPYLPAAGDIALLQYTSGSTGDPKGVVLTHDHLLANIRAMGTAIAIDDDDVFVSWLPLYHDMGLIGAWLGSALIYGARLVVMSPTAFLRRPASWLRTVDEAGATLSAAPNFGYEMCVHRLRDAELAGLDLSRWRLAFNGAEPVSANALEAFCERFAPYGFAREAMAPVYGLAECALGLTFPPLGRGPVVDTIAEAPFARERRAVPPAAGRKVLRFVGCGRPLPGYRVRIADGSGRELPERREGYVLMEGPSTTSGYYRNPEATAGLLRDGWLDTGDLGYFADGELFVTRRAKDMIIRGGRNLFPYELEEAVGDLPQVRKGCVAVFGATDRRTGSERVVVLAEVRDRAGVDAAELRRRVEGVAVDLLGMPVDEVVLAPPGTVLKTSSGKIRRSACRERFEQGRLGAAERPVWLQLLSLAASGLPGQLARAARRAAGVAWGVYALALTGVLGLVFVPLALAAPSTRAAWRVARTAVGTLRRLAGCPLHVAGRERLGAEVRTGAAVVLAANHASYSDWLVLVAALPADFAFVAKAELARHPLLGPLLRKFGTEFVERFEARQSVADADRIAGAVAGGRNLLIFPEGTFRRTPGLTPFRLGGFQAAARAGAAVVPVVLNGTRAVLPSGSWLPRRAAIRVDIGPPIEPGGRGWPDAIALRDATRAAMAERLDEPLV